MNTHPKYYLYKRIVQAKLFIDNNFSENIDLDNIADEAAFSKFHFIRIFKIVYGKTPHQYLMGVRIENAKLLLQKDLSIMEVCFNIGFDSVTTFTGLFRRYTNLSPAAWQHQFKKRKELIKKQPLQFIPNCFAEQKGWKKE